MSERSKVKARINLWRDENKRYLRYGQSGLDTSIMDETATHARQDEGTEWTYSDHDDDDDSDGVMAMAERKREIPGWGAAEVVLFTILSSSLLSSLSLFLLFSLFSLSSLCCV
jgi:hypothetical protein